ncbi:RB1-inducible coiled-coil protein 1-like isoform X2 [Diachasmimorpha longicaudata]|uniref:RB1-inducible coiled-coil protein 1-like isoform X2 n=1 Tax=Diachasmimorpha longicaudata TaxID=58733 RepID=UPI0030B8AE9E
MLYIFHVDTGATLTFDIKLALQSVAELKEAIERECGVLAVHQVLLMSGGESLEPNARVCSYSAGTDTNPIYLFSKAAIESQVPPVPHTDYSTDVDLVEQITASLVMPATYSTLVARAQLAQQCCVIAREQTRTCERLVHDQHLQQQGWAAVVANLEDITQMFQSKADLLQQSFTHYLTEREQHMQLLNNFNTDLGTLSKIPILPALRAQAEGLLSPDEQSSDHQEHQDDPDEVLSLLRWISAKDNQSSLEQVAEQCSRGLEQFDQRMMEALKNDVGAAILGSNRPEMKEIKGLGERLFALEQLLNQTKKLVQEQGELAQGFLQNQTRANNLGDPSVLPDLCASHRRQLMVMMENHSQLRDIRRRCTRAKEELSVNIYHRLKWITYVENKMMEVDGKLVMYHENLKRLRRHLEVLQQIHLAPHMYVTAVSEVVRRRTFSQAFLVWASNLACQLLTVHSEEIEKRREFHSKFEGHFLNTLFPGLEDTPPPFATQAPTVFDSQLPKLTAEDMQSLKHQLPDLAGSVSTPDLNSITQFFLSKSFNEGSGDGCKDKVEESTLMPVDIDSKGGQRETIAMTPDRVGFESETDIEEFEKIVQGKDGKPTCYETKDKLTKQLEVGGSRSVSPTSSISTNMSSLNSRVDFNRSTALCPLIECIEINEPSTYPLNPLTNAKCDGQLSQPNGQLESGDSSPFGEATNCDFLGTEFYMDESLPSSLSEHHSDGHHQAIVNLLQENLGNTRAEVERLRTILRTVKTAMNDAVTVFRDELAVLRDKVNDNKCGIHEMTERIGQTLTVQSRECERALREREQELTVDHELELTDAKKILGVRDEEINNLKRSIMDKDTELAEHERLVATVRQKLDTQQEEMRNIQLGFQAQLKDAIEQAIIDKENSLEQNNQARLVEIASLTSALEQCRQNVKELEDNLANARSDQLKLLKEATDKLQMEHKTELETIRSRFKLMAASTVMERSPSDSSLEKIERPDVIELINHEAILAQTKEDLIAEKVDAVRKAIEKETVDFEAKLQFGLRMVEKQMGEEAEAHRIRETALVEECEKYQEIIRRLTEDDSRMRQTLSEKVEKLEEEKHRLEKKMATERKVLKQRESQLQELQAERNELRQELTEGRIKISQSAEAMVDDGFKSLMSISKDDIDVSESKKVRLEANTAECLTRRVESLEIDNKRLAATLQVVQESKEAIEAKFESLEADKIRLEVELVKERSRRGFVTDISASIDGRDKEMNTSVAVVSESGSAEAGSSDHQIRQDATFRYREKLIKSTTNLFQQSCISLNSCNPGDSVIVLWDTDHSNYIILQESRTMYFLHSECIDTLKLRRESDGLPKQIYVLGEVIDKQYCHAKKSENRYHVPQGTKFYRVRVKPIQRDLDLTTSSSDTSQQ